MKNAELKLVAATVAAAARLEDGYPCRWCRRETPDEQFHSEHRSICQDCWSKHERPSVGDPATYSIGSDSYPYTVTRVSPSGKTIWVRADGWRYGVYIPAQGEEKRCHWVARQQAWRFTGSRCGTVTVGFRDNYRDPSF